MSALGNDVTDWPGTRDRLLLAAERLLGCGIIACGRVDADPVTARRALEAEILRRYPAAACSYVFWTATDEDAVSSADGDLVAPLLLHYNGPPVAGAVRAALAEQGLQTRPGSHPLTLQLVVEPPGLPVPVVAESPAG